MTCHVEVSRRPHEWLRLELMRLGMVLNVAGADPTAFDEAHRRLAAFARDEVVAHLQRDEAWLNRAEQCPEARLLAIAMRAEARALTGAVQELTEARDWVDAVGATRVVHTLLAAHAHHAELLAGAVSEADAAAPDGAERPGGVRKRPVATPA